MMIITSKDKIDADRCVENAWRQAWLTAEESQQLRAMISAVPVGAAVRAPTLPIVETAQPVMVTRSGPYERLVLRNE